MKRYDQRKKSLPCHLLIASCFTLLAPAAAVAADFTIGAGVTQTTQKTLLDNETGTIESGGTLDTSSTASTAISATGSNVVITNSGAINAEGANSNGVDSNAANASINNSGTINTDNIGISSDGENASITNSGNMNNSYINILSTGDNTRITNSGTIISTSYLGLGSGGDNASITNSGTIDADDDGIYSTGLNANITNSGTINADNYGILSTGLNANITNSGTIDAVDDGIYSSDLNASITNSGTIDADDDGLYSGAADANITNSGTINAIATGIKSTGENASITNSGTINTIATGITSTGENASITNSGTIGTIAASIGISSIGLNANITNSGTINAGYDGIYLNGAGASITNSGAINTDATGITSTGLNANITNSGTIDAVDDGIYIGAANTTITNSGLISGTSHAVEGDSGATGMTLNLLEGSRLIGAIDLGGTGDNDTVNIYGGSSSANLSFLNTENINLFGAGVVVGNKIITVDATAESTRDVALSQFTSSVHSLISQRMANTGVSQPVQVAALTLSPSMFFAERKPFAWAQFFGGQLNRDAQGTALAYDSRHMGVNFGYEWDNDKTRIGAVGGIVNAQTESKIASFETKTDSYYIGGYSHSKLGMLNLTTSLIGGFSESDNERVVIDNMNGAQVAKSDMSSTFISLGLSLDAAFKATDNIELRPAFSVNYSVAQMDDYQESGTTNSNLSVDKRNLNVLSGRAQLGTAFKINDAAELEFRVGASSRSSRSANVNASIAGNAFSYSNGGDERVNGGFVGVNLLFARKNNLRLSADVERGGNSDEDYVNGYLRLDYSF